MSQCHHNVPEEKRSELKEITDKLINYLKELGYRDNYATYQEHVLMGSTSSPTYAKEPHKPIGIIKGDLTVEEANKARRLAKRQNAMGQYFLEDGFVTILYEPLDENGNTIRDPEMLDEDLNPILTKYAPNFPFRRE